MNQAAVAHLRRHTVCKLMPPIPQHVFEWVYFVWPLSAKSWILKLGVPHFAPRLRGSTSFTLWRISPPFLGKPASCVGGLRYDNGIPAKRWQGQWVNTYGQFLSRNTPKRIHSIHVFLAAVGLSLVASPCFTISSEPHLCHLVIE